MLNNTVIKVTVLCKLSQHLDMQNVNDEKLHLNSYRKLKLQSKLSLLRMLVEIHNVEIIKTMICRM